MTEQEWSKQAICLSLVSEGVNKEYISFEDEQAAEWMGMYLLLRMIMVLRSLNS